MTKQLSLLAIAFVSTGCAFNGAGGDEQLTNNELHLIAAIDELSVAMDDAPDINAALESVSTEEIEPGLPSPYEIAFLYADSMSHFAYLHPDEWAAIQASPSTDSLESQALSAFVMEDIDRLFYEVAIEGDTDEHADERSRRRRKRKARSKKRKKKNNNGNDGNDGGDGTGTDGNGTGTDNGDGTGTDGDGNTGTDGDGNGDTGTDGDGDGDGSGTGTTDPLGPAKVGAKAAVTVAVINGVVKVIEKITDVIVDLCRGEGDDGTAPSGGGSASGGGASGGGAPVNPSPPADPGPDASTPTPGDAPSDDSATCPNDGDTGADSSDCWLGDEDAQSWAGQTGSTCPAL